MALVVLGTQSGFRFSFLSNLVGDVQDRTLSQARFTLSLVGKLQIALLSEPTTAVDLSCSERLTTGQFLQLFLNRTFVLSLRRRLRLEPP
jgi:hypothetical protein